LADLFKEYFDYDLEEFQDIAFAALLEQVDVLDDVF